MKYRHKQTGEVVELPYPMPKNSFDWLKNYYLDGGTVAFSKGFDYFHANYEPLEELINDNHC